MIRNELTSLQLTKTQMKLLRNIMKNSETDLFESGYNANGSIATEKSMAEFEELINIIRKR